MTKDVHSEFKIQCMRKDLSMQEVIEAFASRVAAESNDMMRLLEQIKKDKQIKDVKAVDGPWRKKIVKKLKQNLGVDLTHIYEYDNLMDINIQSIEYCREMLNITTPMLYASKLDVEGTKSELLANLVKRMNGTTYISGPSGKDYLDLKHFNDIEVKYFEPKVDNYYSTLYNIHK